MNVGLTIAGSDSGGGAGIQADIKAMHANGIFAASVITAVTAQNTREVTQSFELPLDIIEAQIDAVLSDIPVHVTKTGMLSSSGVIELVAGKVTEYGMSPLVVDPVMVSKSGFKLLQDDAIETLKSELLPLATLVTPNIHEAELLAGNPISTVKEAEEAARRIIDFGPQAVLVKGGHLADGLTAIDVLYDGERLRRYEQEFIESRHTHGTGCTFASAIAAAMALGFTVENAIERAKLYITEAIRHGFEIGEGHGPTNHFYVLPEPVLPPRV